MQHPSSAFSLQNNGDISSSQLCDALRQKVNQSFQDKTQKILIGTFKNLEPLHVKELNDFYEDLNQKSLQETDKLQNEVFAIVYLMKDLKKEVAIEKLKGIDIEQFEGRLIDLENKIAMLNDIFCKKSSLLRHEEQVLQADVASMANKIDEWAKPVKVDRVLPSVHHTSVLFNSGCSYNVNVNNFQKFLRDHGGHTGNWDEADHLLFIRLRRKYPNKQVLFKHLKEEFPDKSLEELYEHDHWYANYENLKAKQKEAILEWRNSKNKSYLRTVGGSNEISSHTMLKVKPNLNLDVYDFNSRKELQKQQLEQWKNAKILEQKMAECKREEELQKQMIEEETRKMRHAIIKAEVEQYRQEKVKEEIAIALQKQAIENAETEKRARSANKMLRVFRQRDAELLARHKEMKEQLQQVQEDKKKVLETLREKVRIEVARDPRRLLQPTGSWKERTKLRKDVKGSSIQSSVPLNVHEVPHLGIPAWRKNLK